MWYLAEHVMNIRRGRFAPMDKKRHNRKIMKETVLRKYGEEWEEVQIRPIEREYEWNIFIRDNYLVEAFEILEMYCDFLLARFGLIEQMKTLDDGIAEAVISIIWAAPRLANDIQEFKTISDQLTIKYGKPFAEAARADQLESPAKVSPKLISKLSVAAPPKVMVER
ncbi:unnamed protein product [Cylicocyclus nassatus]|uniref:IST1 homolog n=1 Tax=Cylicocyclus nassatus TaxID=53992 RepID=A0AA36ME69_CYLNA|nr:unnamed protein product [Cylicocyclus nassatus]